MWHSSLFHISIKYFSFRKKDSFHNLSEKHHKTDYIFSFLWLLAQPLAIRSAVSWYPPHRTKFSLSRYLQCDRYKSDSVLLNCASACPPVLRFKIREKPILMGIRIHGRVYIPPLFLSSSCNFNIAYIFSLVNSFEVKIYNLFMNFLHKL